MAEIEMFFGVAFSVIVFIVIFAAVAQRLLGLRVGIIRTLLTGLVGTVGLAVFGAAMQRPEQGGAITTVQIGCTFLLATAFLAVSEVVVPSGSSGSPAGWLRAVRSRVARASRYSHIIAIAVRHGLRPYLRRGRDSDGVPTTGRARLVRSLRLALEEGGATFVKLGQVLSTRHDLLPPEFIAELSKLQYQVPEEPWKEVERLLEQDLGRPPGEVFAHFEQEPLAAASIAQVHRARLHSGEEVVVKVQRPGVRPLVERDLDIICRLGRMLETRTSWARALGTAELAEGFAASVEEELDFRIEAQNLAAVTNAWSRREEQKIGLPVVHEELSGERVMVLERLPGLPISVAYRSIDERFTTRTDIARNLLFNMLQQILVDGIFHADPHPGNILLSDDGRISLVDFGSVGRLDGQLRAALGRYLLAIHHGDPAALCDALLELVARPDEINERELERALGRFMARHLSGGSVPDFQVFADLFRLVARHGLAVPPEVAAVFRALGTLEGTLTKVSPGFDVIGEARTFADGEQEGRGGFGWGNARSSGPGLDLHAAVTLLQRLPRRLDRVTSALEQGRLGMSVRLFADARDRKYLRSLVHEVLITFLGATSGVMAVILLAIPGGPDIAEDLSLFRLLGYHLLVISAVLVLRMLFTVFRAKR
ncbi:MULTISPECIES: ABC1 kinase family protein [unclassified Streptomyces]|uniref:ABC1 kinase family protein n=1 Tax=unclassified Streptomyces TaxID=2593676 RepID=UPI002E2B2713|nr:AarF/UbiB family protein [Streptomyces sp. NBC_00273]